MLGYLTAPCAALDHGSTVIVTGAAGGIGSAIAEQFARPGTHLLLTDRSQRTDSLADVAERCEKEGAATTQVPATLPNDTEKVVGEAKPLAKEAVLVNNAGINPLRPALEVPAQEWRQTLDTNVSSAFFLSQQFAAEAVRDGTSGMNRSIVNVCSQHGVVANMDRVSYCASKAALLHMSRALALEWAEHGIRVNCVSPTVVETPENREILRSDESVRELIASIPTQRAATPAEVAQAVQFLTGESAGMITGHNLMLDGGWTLAGGHSPSRR